jgi:hypothetical protein
MADIEFDDNALRDEARRRAEEGQIPCRSPERVWAGPGAGFDCSLCGRPITHAQVEYELQFSVFPKLVTCRFHRECHEAWEEVCVRGT